MATLKGLTVEISGSTTKLSESLRAVEKDIKTTQGEIKNLDKLLKFDPSNIELLSQKQQAFTDAIGKTKDKLDTLNIAQQQAKQHLENGTLGRDKYNALQQEIIKTEQELTKLANEAAKANTALKKIGDIGSTLTNAGQHISNVGKNLTTYVTLPLAGIATAAVTTGMDFDAAMSRVKAISGATGDEFNALREKAREMGANTKFSATEAADALAFMAMAGWKTEEMLNGIEGIMNLAAASGEDLSRTSDIVTDALSAFGLTAKDAGRFADVLAAASNNANTNVSLLGESFQYIATSAGAYNFSIEDTAIALGIMANAGIKSTQAGSSLKNALVNLTKPTKQQTKAMQDLGLITTEYVTNVDSNKVSKAQNAVEKATLALQNAQAKYNAVLREQGANSTAAINAHGNLEKAQIKVRDATSALSEAQNKYNQAVREHGSNSSQAESAHRKVEAAQSRLQTATVNLNTAQEKYNRILQTGNTETPKTVAARNAVEKAEIALREAQNKLAQAQQGTTKAIAGQNTLLTDANGNVRDLDSIIRILRSTLGETNVELVDSNGTVKDFDVLLQEAAEHGANLTQIQKLQSAAIIFGKQNMAGMLALVNASKDEYDTLSIAVKNATYHLDDMSTKLQNSDINWNKYLQIDAFKSADEAFRIFAKGVADQIANAKKNGEGMEVVIDNLVKTYGMSADEAKKTVDIVSGEMQNFGGTAKQTAEIMNDNLKGQLTILKSALQELAIQISDALTPTIRNIVSGIQSFVEKLQQMDEGTRNSILRWGLFLAAIGPVLTILGTLTSGFGMVFTGISKLGTGILTLWNQFEAGVGIGAKIGSVLTTLTSGPVLAITAGVAALAAGFIYLWNTNEEFRDKCLEIWETVKAAFTKLWDVISNLLSALTPVFQAALFGLQTIWEGFCQLLAPILEGAFIIIASKLQAAVDILSGILNVFKGIFTGDWNTFWDGIKSIFEGIWGLFEGIVSGVFTAIKGVVSVFFSWLSAFWEMSWNAIKAVFELIWNGISAFFSAIWDGIKAVISTVLGAISSIISTSFNAIAGVFSTIWNSIKGSLETVWEGMKNVVEFALLAIVELIKTAFNLITLPFRFIWENCKDIIISYWNNIKDSVSESVSSVANLLSKAWEGIKSSTTSILSSIADFVSDTWDSIKNSVSEAAEDTKNYVVEKWEDTKGKVSPIVESITTWIGDKWDEAKDRVSNTADVMKDYVSSKWDMLKESVSSTADLISTYVSDKWDSIKEYTSGVWDRVKDYVLDIWDSIKDGVSSKVQGMWDSVKNMFTGLWNTISNIIQRIRDCFSFDWKLPKIKLPHFKIKGSFSLAPPSVPSLSIEWYKKAMENAYILKNPTIFGQRGDKLLGGGEAGEEVVIGTRKLTELIRNAVSAVSPEINLNQAILNQNINGNNGNNSSNGNNINNGISSGDYIQDIIKAITSETRSDIIIPVYIGQERIEEIVVRANQSANYRSGGR